MDVLLTGSCISSESAFRQSLRVQVQAESLGEAEADILGAYARGVPWRDYARRRGISPAAAVKRLQRARERLCAATAAAAVVHASLAGLLTIDPEPTPPTLSSHDCALIGALASGARAQDLAGHGLHVTGSAWLRWPNVRAVNRSILDLERRLGAGGQGHLVALGLAYQCIDPTLTWAVDDDPGDDLRPQPVPPIAVFPIQAPSEGKARQHSLAASVPEGHLLPPKRSPYPWGDDDEGI